MMSQVFHFNTTREMYAQAIADGQNDIAQYINGRTISFVIDNMPNVYRSLCAVAGYHQFIEPMLWSELSPNRVMEILTVHPKLADQFALARLSYQHHLLLREKIPSLYEDAEQRAFHQEIVDDQPACSGTTDCTEATAQRSDQLERSDEPVIGTPVSS